jgi:VWFA-related protein
MRHPVASRWWLIPSIAAAVLSAAPLVRTAGSPQDPAVTFRGRADFVSVDVSVRRNGRPVTGLLARDFELLDSGVPQEISEISYEKLPIDVTVALDVSASVSGAVLDQLRRSTGQLRGDLGPQDRMKLMAFNMRVTHLVDLSQPAARIDAALASVTASGSSSIFDVVATALATPADVNRRQLIVLFTDGQDSSSITDPAALLEVARRTTPTVAIVLAGSPTSAVAFRSTRSEVDVAFRRVYDRLAADTGGIVVTAAQGGNLSSTFRRVLDEFRSSYVLHFTPRQATRPGFHPLTVRVKTAEPVEVRARTGYTLR